jgi:dTDP-4-amino-4,6-dideoxygalactose transaminase
MSSALIPVNSLSRHVEALAGLLQDAAADVIGSGYYVMGPNVTAFEAAFAFIELGARSSAA